MEKKINLGCGLHVVDGWINVDYALGARMFKIPLFSDLNKKLHLFKREWDRRILIHDLRRQFPFQDESIDVVYSSHTLEHFTREEGLRFLKECHRVLKKNCIIRIVVPDLEEFAAKYVRGEMSAVDFVDQLGVRTPNQNSGLFRKTINCLIAFPHKCMYDHSAMLEAMRMTGFQGRRRAPFDSEIPDIRSIEIESRTHDAVIVEAVKE